MVKILKRGQLYYFKYGNEVSNWEGVGRCLEHSYHSPEWFKKRLMHMHNTGYVLFKMVAINWVRGSLRNGLINDETAFTTAHNFKEILVSVPLYFYMKQKLSYYDKLLKGEALHGDW